MVVIDHSHHDQKIHQKDWNEMFLKEFGQVSYIDSDGESITDQWIDGWIGVDSDGEIEDHPGELLPNLGSTGSVMLESCEFIGEGLFSYLKENPGFYASVCFCSIEDGEPFSWGIVKL